MSTLSFSSKRFYFDAHNSADKYLARDAGLITDGPTLRWVTRSFEKAVKLRRFADESAERKFKKYFITHFKPPECILYPDHLSPKTFQIESAWHCTTRSPAYNADEAGLGKTITSILCMNSVPGKTLIVCPPFLKHSWFDEIKKWSTNESQTTQLITTGEGIVKSPRTDVIIVPDSMLTNARIRSYLSGLKFTWLFVDEAHRFKDPDAQRTIALMGDDKDEAWCVADSAERIVLLSGTPIPNGKPIELYPLLSRLVPESTGWRSRLAYGNLFCAGKQVTRFEGKKAIVQFDFNGASNLKKLRGELRKKLMVRHLKKDVLRELPPKTRKLVFLDQPNSLLELEKKILNNRTLDELLGEDHQLGDIATYRRQVGEAKINQAFKYIHEFLEETDSKLVVFAHHISVVETLTRMLKPFRPLMIRGGMTAAEKAIRVGLFQTERKHRVIIGNIDSIGVGNTLTKAPHAIFVEWSWNPGINEQAEDRIHRITQDKNVYIKYLVLRDSLDERILRRILEKQENINQMMS